MRVREAVSPHLEMTEIQTRLLAEGGPAVSVRECRRTGWQAFGHAGAGQPVRHRRARRHGHGAPPRPAARAGRDAGLSETARAARRLARSPRHAAHGQDRHDHAAQERVGNAPCQEIVWTGGDIDLAKLPIQTCWPGEPAPLITWPLVVTQGPNPGGDKADNFNLGIYRMQVTGPNTTLMRWLKHRGGAQHHARWKKVKPEPLPAAVVIGADPGTILAAVTPVPDTLSEYQFAGLAARGQGRAGGLQDRAAEGAGGGRDRHRGPCRPRPLRR